MINYWNILKTAVYIIGGIVVVYPIITFLLGRLFVPMLGFTETRIRKKLPIGMDEKIHELEKKSKNKREYVSNVWKFITSKYHGKSNEFVKHPSTLWWSLGYSWKKKGFLPCTMMTYITRILLVKSKFFTKKEVRTHTYFYGLVMHQCLQIKVEDGWIYIDPWAEHLGYGIGRKLELF